MRWVTFPLYPIASDGSCCCRDGRACKDAGKHPSAKWGKNSLGPGMCIPIPEGYGIGVATGERSDVFGVDLDRKDGKDGLAALMLLGDVPETLTAATPTGGFHLYFKYPDFKIHNSASVLGPGIDIRGDGGYLVLPPSPHRKGGYYEWVNPETPVAEAPAWLLELIKNPKKTHVVKRTTLERLAKQWKRSKSLHKQELGEALERVCKGESFAESGERDTTLYNLAVNIAEALPGGQADKIAELFIPSLDLMGRESPDAPTYEVVLEKMTRALAEQVTTSIQDDGSWTAQMAVSDNGIPKSCEGNIVIILQNHSELKDLFGFDERRQREVFLRPPPWALPGEVTDVSTPTTTGYYKDVSDHDLTFLATWLTKKQRITVSSDMCGKAINAVAKNKSFDQVREYLLSLKWDGIRRLDDWLHEYAGVENTTYTRTVAGKFMISAVARALEPGCKVDTMLILEGGQGKYKSTLLRTLAGAAYFADDLPDIEGKDAKDHIRGPWIVEIKELNGFDRKEANAVKGFIDQRKDRFRPAYGHKTLDFERRNVFCGTTNAEEYLKDWTGNRRFWPVKVSAKCDYKGLEVVRDQLWAEAVVRFMAGEKWWLEDHQEELAVGEQEIREETDSWTEKVIQALEEGARRRGVFGVAGQVPKSEWAITPRADSVSIGELLEYAIGIPAGQCHRGHEMRVSVILKKIGWVRKRGTSGSRGWRYFKQEQNLVDPTSGSPNLRPNLGPNVKNLKIRSDPNVPT